MKILALSGDAGGAQAVHAVCTKLAHDRHQLEILTYGPAARIFDSYATILPDSPTTLTEATQRLKSFQPDAVILGTSINERNDEKAFILASRALGVPSLSVLDFWSNYKGRFSSDIARPQLDALPDCIAVMDETAKSDLEALGVPSDQIEVTGQPAFDRLYDSTPLPSAIAELRNALTCSSQRGVILFASQPFQELADQAGIERVPYSEVAIAEKLLEATNKRQLHLWIRPHPRESAEKFNLLRDEGAILSQAGTSTLAMHLADGVVGITSMFLLESALIGKPVLSLQPGSGGSGPIPLERLRIGRVVTKTDFRYELDQWLQELCLTRSTHTKPNTPALSNGASARVVEVLTKVVAQHSRNRPF